MSTAFRNPPCAAGAETCVDVPEKLNPQGSGHIAEINPPQALAFVYRTASFAVVFTTHHDSAHQVFT